MDKAARLVMLLLLAACCNSQAAVSAQQSTAQQFSNGSTVDLLKKSTGLLLQLAQAQAKLQKLQQDIQAIQKSAAKLAGTVTSAPQAITAQPQLTQQQALLLKLRLAAQQTSNRTSQLAGNASAPLLTRKLLASNSTSSAAGSSNSVTTATATSNSTRKTNSQIVGSLVHLLMSDGWMIGYNGFAIMNVCIKLFVAMLSSMATGMVNVDASLIIDLADLASGLGAEVSWLLNSIFQIVSDAEIPLELQH